MAYFQRYSGVQTVEEVTADRLRQFFVYGRLTKHWTPDTHMSYYKGIGAFLKWCERRKYIPANPLDEIEKPRLGKHLPKRISEDQAYLLLESALNLRYSYRFEKYRNHALLSVLLLTGLRSKETLSLGLNDVDLQEDVIMVRSGKGNKDRVVPICAKLKAALMRYMEERDRLGRQCPCFFTSLHGDQPFTYHGMKKVIDRLRRVTSIDFTAHRLRHTFATLMLEKGCDLFALSKMLGHSDIKTTTIYLSASVTYLKEQIKKHPFPFAQRKRDFL